VALGASRQENKCLILTTHALEEAEALCDRIGIMTLGLMRTIGRTTELRIRFDRGYKLLVAAAVSRQSEVIDFVRQLMPHSTLRDELNGTANWYVPKEGLKLSHVFRELEGAKQRLSISAWALSNTTLEEVFLDIVAESAGGKGKPPAQTPPRLTSDTAPLQPGIQLNEVDADSRQVHSESASAC